jgi:ribosome-associated protein
VAKINPAGQFAKNAEEKIESQDSASSDFADSCKGDASVAKPIVLRGEQIALAQAVKLAGLADTGGQAKVLVRAGKVYVNGAVELRPGHKLHAGDKLGDDAGREWVVQA